MRDKVAIVGSTRFNNYLKFKKALEFYIPRSNIEYIITRGLPGTENMASMYCKEYDIYNKVYKITENTTFSQLDSINVALVKEATRIIVFNDGDSSLFQSIINVAKQNNIKVDDILMVEQKGTNQTTISKFK